MRTFFDFDAKLRNVGSADYQPIVFKRFNSLSALPFDWNGFKSNVSNKLINHFEEMIRKQLVSKFAVPTLARSEHGSLVNIDEALEGIPECYRHIRPVKSVLKLGLNVSAQYSVKREMFAIRAGAIIAVYNLAKTRGQKVQFDICYGAYGFGSPNSHFRIMLQTPTPELIKRIMTMDFRDAMISHVISPTGTSASYRIHAIERDYPQLGKEFDFVLDRIETNDIKAEYDRIIQQIERLK
jgi:hypothetical protein